MKTLVGPCPQNWSQKIVSCLLGPPINAANKDNPLTFHQSLQTLPHDVNVMDVVELIDDIIIVIGALISLPSCFVGHGIDLYKKF